MAAYQGDLFSDAEPEPEPMIIEEGPVLPPLVKNILSLLGSDHCEAFESFIDEVEENVLDTFVGAVNKCLNDQRADRKDKMFTIFDYQLSVVVAMEKRLDQLRINELRNNVGGVMVSQDATTWTSLTLTFDDGMELKNVAQEVITPRDFSTYDWKIVRVIGSKLKNRT